MPHNDGYVYRIGERSGLRLGVSGPGREGRGLVAVGAPARQDAQDVDGARLGVERDEGSPVADSQSRFRCSGEPA